MVYKEPKRLADFPLSYCGLVIPRSALLLMPHLFYLVYGAKAKVPIQVIAASVRLALAGKLSGSHDVIADLDSVE